MGQLLIDDGNGNIDARGKLLSEYIPAWSGTKTEWENLDKTNINDWLKMCMASSEELYERQRIIRSNVYNTFIDISDYIYFCNQKQNSYRADKYRASSGFVNVLCN